MLKARIETGLAAAAGLLAIVTLIWPTWIETLFGVEPDGGSGEAEWLVVVVLALVAVRCMASGGSDSWLVAASPPEGA